MNLDTKGFGKKKKAGFLSSTTWFPDLQSWNYCHLTPVLSALRTDQGEITKVVVPWGNICQGQQRISAERFHS